MTASASLTILVHEWATGGLAGVEVPRSWRAEGRAMRRSAARDFAAINGVEVAVTLDRSEPDDPGPWATIRLSDSGDRKELTDLARRADYTLVIAPETNGILADLVGNLESAGASSLGCSRRAIEIAGDKMRLMERLREKGIPTPRSTRVRAGETIPEDTPLPAVLKPVDGAGSVDTLLLEDVADLRALRPRSTDMLLQPFLDGIPMSASFLVDADGTGWLIALGRQRIQVQLGRFSYSGGVLPVTCPESLPALRRTVQSLPGLRGFVGVDFLWNPDERRTTILEVNPRLTTSHIGLTRLLPPGRLAQAWLATCGAAGADAGAPEGLADEVQAAQPIGFDVDGEAWPEPRG